MEKSFVKYIYEFFKRLVDVYGFQKKRELNKGQSYIIEFNSDTFAIKIEKYFREFYVSLYKIDRPDYEINLFNLLEYLKRGDEKNLKSNYFRSEKDIEECYRKQIEYISSVIYENYTLISAFFGEEDYELNVDKFEKYWKNKHPEFYKKA